MDKGGTSKASEKQFFYILGESSWGIRLLRSRFPDFVGIIWGDKAGEDKFFHDLGWKTGGGVKLVRNSFTMIGVDTGGGTRGRYCRCQPMSTRPTDCLAQARFMDAARRRLLGCDMAACVKPRW